MGNIKNMKKEIRYEKVIEEDSILEYYLIVLGIWVIVGFSWLIYHLDSSQLENNMISVILYGIIPFFSSIILLAYGIHKLMTRNIYWRKIKDV